MNDECYRGKKEREKFPTNSSPSLWALGVEVALLDLIVAKY